MAGVETGVVLVAGAAGVDTDVDVVVDELVVDDAAEPAPPDDEVQAAQLAMTTALVITATAKLR